MLSIIVLAITLTAPSVPMAQDQPVTSAGPLRATPLDLDALGRETAREDVSQIAQSQQAAVVSNNTINGTSVTGPVTIDGNAFQNLQGLAIINANSGNNVAINASLNVNLNFAPAP